MQDVASHIASRSELSDLFVKLGECPISEDEDLGRYQDWDLKAASASRLADFIAVYQGAELTEAQKRELGRLLLACLDAAFTELGEERSREQARRVERILRAEPHLHQDWMRYWAKFDGETEWRITALVRRILAELDEQEESYGFLVSSRLASS